MFTLGFFLWQQGAASLWGQLVADQGRINLTVVPGLLRHDLEGLSALPPVLCFDEVDLLRPGEVEAHSQLLGFLESLRSRVPCLFIGQQALVEVDGHIVLPGLTRRELETILANAGLWLSPEEARRLHTETRGNPRLVRLLLSLHALGEPVAEVLRSSGAAPSIEFLLNRIWQRLAIREQEVLAELSVFRRPAPEGAWEPDTVRRLIDRDLAQRDPRGGLRLLPALRQVLYGLLPTDNRQLLHLQAAEIRAARAEYTSAAYHYLQGDEPGSAVWLWHRHRLQEMNQGQGAAALALFDRVPTGRLRGADRNALELVRAELRKLAGEDSRSTLRQTLWQSAVLQAQASRLEGDLADLKGQLDQAIGAYQRGLETVENLLAEKAMFHKNLAWVHMRQGASDWRRRGRMPAWPALKPSAC